MPTDDPALFYTGLVARMYSPLRSVGAPDPAPYARFIERSGEPALELGCGGGEPLLDLLALGFDIEGLDSSLDMLARCRATAADRGLDVVVHHQLMESIHLARRYRSIFLAGPTFNLLPDDDTALAALAGIRSHLAPGGSALVPLFEPAPTPPGALGRPRVHVAADGTEMRVTPISEDRDEVARRQITVLRYELSSPSESVVEDHPWILHWYGEQEFRSLAADAGLSIVSRRSAGPDDEGAAVVVLRDGSAD